MKSDFRMPFEDHNVTNSIKTDYSERKKILRSTLMANGFPLKLQSVCFFFCSWWNYNPTEGRSWIKEKLGRDYVAGT